MEIQLTYTGTNMVSNLTFRYTSGNNTGLMFQSQSSTAINATISNNLDLTVQWTVANVNNTITTTYATLSKLF